jgi:hypothetical protein
VILSLREKLLLRRFAYEKSVWVNLIVAA